MSNLYSNSVVLFDERKNALLKQLSKGKWTRPTDRSAVYTEIERDKKWGIRVTLIDNYAKVEAIKGEKGVWYNGPKRYSVTIMPPNIFEKLRGISFEDKIMDEVSLKRQVAAEENGTPNYLNEESTKGNRQ